MSFGFHRALHLQLRLTKMGFFPFGFSLLEWLCPFASDFSCVSARIVAQLWVGVGECVALCCSVSLRELQDMRGIRRLKEKV